MKFTASELWNVACKAPSKVLSWSVYVKKTAALNEALTSGTWINVTEYIPELPPPPQRLEDDFGQFTTDSISLTVRNITWWADNVFNATNYIEMKIVFALGLSPSAMATDVCYTFNGFIDKNSVENIEQDDSVSFSVSTVEDIADRIPAEYLTTQYINTDVDGAGTDGLVLTEIPGIYLVDAAISGYELQPGVHTLTYDNNSGDERMKLDDGAWVTLRTSDGTDTLGNGDTSARDTQQVTIYVDSDAEGSRFSVTERTEQIIVVAKGDTLPRQWYHGKRAIDLLTTIYTAMGLSISSSDTMTFPTFDAANQISCVDMFDMLITSPVGTGVRLADYSGNLFIAVGTSVYVRSSTTNTYSAAIATLAAGDIIDRLIYNAHNQELWILYHNGATQYVRRYDTDAETLSAQLQISTALVNKYACGVMENHQPGLLYADNMDHKIYLVDSSMTKTCVYNTGNVTDNGFGYVLQINNFYVFMIDDGMSGYNYRYIEATAGGWSDLGNLVEGFSYVPYSVAVYHDAEAYVYFYDSAAGKIKCHDYSAGSSADVLAIDPGVPADIISGGDYVYWGQIDITTTPYCKLYKAASGAATLISTGDYFYSLAYSSSRLYGVSKQKVLYQYYSAMEMYIHEAKFEGMSVRNALNKVLLSYNLIGIRRPSKSAYVYRRCDDAGALVNSGSVVDLTQTEIEPVRKIEKAYPGYDVIEVSNGDTTHNYDGTNYDETKLSDSTKFSITSELIHSYCVKSLCKWIYGLMSAAHDKYIVRVLQPLFQYEVMDGASLVTVKYSTADGLIDAIAPNHNGTVEMEVLI